MHRKIIPENSLVVVYQQPWQLNHFETKLRICTSVTNEKKSCSNLSQTLMIEWCKKYQNNSWQNYKIYKWHCEECEQNLRRCANDLKNGQRFAEILHGAACTGVRYTESEETAYAAKNCSDLITNASRTKANHGDRAAMSMTEPMRSCDTIISTSSPPAIFARGALSISCGFATSWVPISDSSECPCLSLRAGLRQSPI